MAANIFGSLVWWEQAFRTSRSPVIWLCLPSHRASSRWAMPGKEKANQERFFLHKEGWDVPIFILNQFYNICGNVQHLCPSSYNSEATAVFTPPFLGTVEGWGVWKGGISGFRHERSVERESRWEPQPVDRGQGPRL